MGTTRFDGLLQKQQPNPNPNPTPNGRGLGIFAVAMALVAVVAIVTANRGDWMEQLYNGMLHEQGNWRWSVSRSAAAKTAPENLRSSALDGYCETDEKNPAWWQGRRLWAVAKAATMMHKSASDAAQQIARDLCNLPCLTPLQRKTAAEFILQFFPELEKYLDPENLC